MDLQIMEKHMVPGSEIILNDNGKKVRYFESTGADIFEHKNVTRIIQVLDKPDEFVAISNQHGMKIMEKDTKDLYQQLTKVNKGEKKGILASFPDFTIRLTDKTGKRGWKYNELRLSGNWLSDGTVQLGNHFEELTSTIQALMKEYNSLSKELQKIVMKTVEAMCKCR